MESSTLNLTTLICDSLNSIFFNFFSSINHTVYSNLDNILFIQPDIIQDAKFQKLFGTDTSNGLLLVANSLIFGIILFYVLKFVVSHLTYSPIDTPYQFIFKFIIFIACMNCSFKLCEMFISLIGLLSDFICEIGYSITGYEISFSSLIDLIHSKLYPSVQMFNIFSFDGILKLCSTIGIIYILMTYSVRYLLCKIFVLLAPFAFISLINHRFDGFFKGWLKQFFILLFMQIFVSLVLVLGFTLDFYLGHVLSELIYFSIVIVIAKCQYTIKELFSHLHQYTHYTLKDFI